MRPVLPLLTVFALTACDGGDNLGQPPVVVLHAPAYCDLGSVITLDGSESTDPDDDITLYRFVIADGTTSREVLEPTVDHTCRVEGLIGVLLEVQDARGNVGQAQVSIAVRPP